MPWSGGGRPFHWVTLLHSLVQPPPRSPDTALHLPSPSFSRPALPLLLHGLSRLVTQCGLGSQGHVLFHRMLDSGKAAAMLTVPLFSPGVSIVWGAGEEQRLRSGECRIPGFR